VNFFSRDAVVVGTVCENEVLLYTLDEQTNICCTGELNQYYGTDNSQLMQ